MRSIVVLSMLVGVTPLGHAQDGGVCDEPTGQGPLEMTPASSSRGVTLDAYIKWRYTPGHFDGWRDDPAELIDVQRLDGRDRFPVSGVVQLVGDYLFFLPDGGLLPDTEYEVQAFGLDFSSDFFDFETVSASGAPTDLAPPEMGPIRDVTSTHVDEWCESPDGGYRIDVSFEPATDDGSPGSIEYLLYLTRGPLVEAPTLVARARNFAATGEGLVTMAFVLTAEEAAGTVCVTVHAVDGLGKVDRSNGAECFDPIQGNFFQGLCSASSGASGSPAPLAGLAFAAVFLVARRCKR